VPGTQTTYDDVTATDITKTYYYKVVAINGVGPSCANNEIAAPFVGDTCSGVIIHQNDPTHPESAAVQNGANPQLAIDYVAVGEPPATTNLMFKMKVSNLSSVPANSRWRMVWDSFSSPGQQYYVGMRSHANSAVTFDYGTIATAVVGLVVGVPTETFVAAALPASNFNADGTITIFVPKSAVGNPQPGDLLGAVNGRTFTGDTPQTNTLERSTALIDHTFVKAQTDNAFPAATYTVVGNVACVLPDLIVSSLTASSNQAPQGAKIPITATITNQGYANAGSSTTKFLVDDGTTATGTVPTPAIAAGQNVNVTFTWNTAGVKKGNHTITANADDMNQVVESNETNNTSAPITIFIQGNQTK